jgi:hypothetical protein
MYIYIYRERERYSKDKRRIDAKRKSSGKVKSNFIFLGGEKASFVRRLLGYARSSF